MLRNAVTPELWDAIDTGSPGDVDFYAQYARHSGGPVLVLMAGSGRICLPIARQGIPVIGLDGEPAVVDLAKRKAQQAGVTRAMFVQGDPTHFTSDNKHPLAIIPDGGLGRLLTLEEQRSCLMTVRTVLQAGGKLLLDLPLLEPGAAVPAATPTVRRVGERAAVLRRHVTFDGARQIAEELIECDWLAPDGTVASSQYATIQSRFATPGELKLLLEACGFAVTLYGSFDREALLPGSRRIVVEAERNR